MTKHYTTPVILQGKVRSTKTLQAQERWFIEFHFEGSRYRKSDGLNRIKDYQNKIKEFSKLRIHYEQLLIGGKFNNIEAVEIEIPLLSNAIKSFIQFQKDKGGRVKSIQSYSSKLYFLNEHYGTIKVNTIQFSHINKLMILLGKKWMPKTFNNCKGIYYGFFEYCISEGYIDTNPVSKIESRYVVKTEKHKVFNEDDFKRITLKVDKNKILRFW
ncbi:hypothetical protein [Sphingobacterium sp. GVS05A]|uniref:hypothetical protein n=1 Tax=Sphingobacterium sp. GVS05A TaxID=2862679 RepID=UPI001CBD66E7|nr:hypothetical protein [Sphingobacterium sp. GVS05A]